MKLPPKYRTYVRKEIRDLVDTIQKRRRDLKISQTELSEEINISFKTLQAIEQGTRKPSLEVLVAMCKALKIRLDLR